MDFSYLNKIEHHDKRQHITILASRRHRNCFPLLSYWLAIAVKRVASVVS